MARFIMAGRIQAFTFVILFSIIGLFLPLLSLFSNAAIALVTLRNGWQSGLGLCLASAGSLSLLTLLDSSGEVNLAGGFLLALAQWLPIVLFATVLHTSVSWQRTLESIFLLTAVSVLIFHAFVPDPAAFWSGLLDKNLRPILEASNTQQIDVDQWLKTFATWMTAFIALLTSLGWAVSMLLARYWQAQLYNPGGFAKEFRSLQLGKVATLVLILLIAITAVTQNKIAVELLVCGLGLFLLQGISLLHAVVKQRELSPVILVIFYIALFMLPIHIGLLLTAFGIVDNFADFRAKLFK